MATGKTGNPITPPTIVPATEGTYKPPAGYPKLSPTGGGMGQAGPTVALPKKGSK
jgi:hypothetical protein